jgi:hypothetical protein
MSKEIKVKQVKMIPLHLKKEQDAINTTTKL